MMYDYTLLIENSLFLKYWKFLTTLFTFIIALIYLKNKEKYYKNKNTNNVGKKLAEEEYIGGKHIYTHRHTVHHNTSVL